MNKKKFMINQSPHIKSKGTGQRIMRLVFLSLIPAACAGVYFFGMNSLIILILATLSAWITDLLIQEIIRRHKKFEGNNYKKIRIINWSSLLTGLFIGLILPPGIRLWLPVLGSFIAVSFGKYAFGKGNNIFNPALIGRVFLVISFPALMAKWIIPDGITSATPLSVLKSDGFSSLVAGFGSKAALYKSMVIGNVGGSIGETSVIALLAGAVFLLCLKIINWRIPVSYIGAIALTSFVFGRDIIFDTFSGGLILGAFFMATDYVTSPITKKGKLIFGVGCGILTIIIRVYSAYPEGVAFSILLMNATVPIIERYTKQRTLGVKS